MPPGAGLLPIPTLEEIERISALSDPVIRNLQITQCYHELSAVMASRTGPSPNWCTFATWASKQAGVSIRKEDLLRALESLFIQSASLEADQDLALAAQELGAQAEPLEIRLTVWELIHPAEALERASQAVGRGNRKVFAEIGREFARFFAACLSDPAPDPARLEAFCSELRPGDPPDGQGYLRQAFTRYYRSFFEPDAKKRAELLFHANLEIGLHEQTRLQPEIKEAMEAGLPRPGVITLRLILPTPGLRTIFPKFGLPALGRWLFQRLRGRRTRLESAVEALVQAARQQVRLTLTEHLMAITLPPDVSLRLGTDLGLPFPAALQALSDQELSALLERIDPTPDSPVQSGALDWADLPERMHLICDLFRCYGDSPDLFMSPYNQEQVAALKSGRLPGGRL
jgi:hypothetical protein